MTQQMLKKEGNQLLFTWQKTNFTKNYELEISREASFKQLFKKETLTENYYVLRSPPSGNYWWRVRSFAAELSSPMSAPSTFSISR